MTDASTDTRRRRSSDRREVVAPPPGGVERRNSQDRRREDDTVGNISEAFLQWSASLRALGPRLTNCIQLADFVDHVPEMLGRLRGAADANNWERVCVMAGELERAGLRISLRAISIAARNVQMAAVLDPPGAGATAAIDQLDELATRAGHLIKELLEHPV